MIRPRSLTATGTRHVRRVLASACGTLLVGASVLLTAGPAGAETVCPAPELTSGLQLPQSIAQSALGNLLVSESGLHAPNTGRISIVDLTGHRRTLVAGLPSGISDVGEPAGPAGLFLRGRTLFVAIGIGDAILAGAVPRTATANPSPSSPIFSSVLAIHFSAHVEKTTAGFTLSPADQQAVAAGRKVTLSNGRGDAITIELVADFPDSTPEPLAHAPDNVRGSNPFDLVAVADQLYVTDGGQNLAWQVDMPTGAFSVLATFPPVANPLPVGPPATEAVPTGIAYADRQLLVALLRGVPFAPGTSAVARIDPSSGSHVPFITGLKTAIDVLRLKERGAAGYLVLQHSSGFAPFFTGPGLVLRFEASGGPPSLVADCLERPTSMVHDERTGTLYVTELLTGRVVAIAVSP